MYSCLQQSTNPIVVKFAFGSLLNYSLIYQKLGVKTKLIDPIQALGNTGGFLHIKNALEYCIENSEI